MMVPQNEYPVEVGDTLTRLVGALDEQLGASYSLATYGGWSQLRIPLARRVTSVALIVETLTDAVLRELRKPLSQALRRCHLDVFLVEFEQLPRIADSFAVKLLEMKLHHAMLRGRDPFSELVINRECVRLRLEQESRNQLMRLRRAFLLKGDSPESLAITVQQSFGKLLSQCEVLLSFVGCPAPSDVDDLLDSIANQLKVSREALGKLSTCGVGCGLAEAQSTYFVLLNIVERVVRFVDELECGALVP